MFLDMLFFYSQKHPAADLHFMTMFQLKIFFTVFYVRKNPSNILNVLRESKWTANFHFKVNYPFKRVLLYWLSLHVCDLCINNEIFSGEDGSEETEVREQQTVTDQWKLCTLFTYNVLCDQIWGDRGPAWQSWMYSPPAAVQS